MADDAAGAVRRTPRTAQADQPTTRDQLIERAFAVADEHQPDGRNHYGYDQCDCGWVAEGGTERWADHLVHLLAVAGLLADPEQHAELERLRAQVALLGKHLQSGAEKDKRIVAWRVEAEQAHQNWEAARAANETALGTIATLTAERDALQARIDAALALMDYWDEHGGSIPQGHRLRAALQGDQPSDRGSASA